MKLVNILAGLIVAVSGCENIPPEKVSNKSLKGTVTPEGHLIFFEWTTCEGGKRHHFAALRDDYGMMIFYNAFAENPLARYELYSYKNKSIYKTHNLEEFKEALNHIPSGKRLHYYDTCAGGTHHGLEPNQITDIEALCKNKNVVFQNGDDEIYTICTCP